MRDAWEDIDATGRYFGVFACDGDSPKPVAIFSNEKDAVEWLEWQSIRDDDNALGSCDYAVCIVEKLEARVWNSINEPPTQSGGDAVDGQAFSPILEARRRARLEMEDVRKSAQTPTFLQKQATGRPK